MEFTTFLNERFSSFTTKPVLFVGSGISRRYLGLPSWSCLLEHFTEITLPNNPLAFRAYENRAKTIIDSEGLSHSYLYPTIASLIQTDFNNMVFNSPGDSYEFDENELKAIRNGEDPFKLAVAKYISNAGKYTESYTAEYSLFSSIENKISNIITTNYDSFLENSFSSFTAKIGQNDILNKRSYMVGNIFKIHGSSAIPSSIVINREDYEMFEKKQKFLSAKILTMLLEFPVIFLGYSVSDSNIQSIFSDIKSCLDPSMENQLAKKLLFIDYAPDEGSQEIVEIEVAGLKMTKVKLYDYSNLYRAFNSLIDSIDIAYLNMIEDKIVQLIETTNKAVDSVYAESIEDITSEDNKVAIYIGHPSSVFNYGYSTVGMYQYCEDALFNNRNYDPIGIIEQSIESQKARFNHSKLPIWKYVVLYNKELTPFVKKRLIYSLDDLYTPSMKNMKLYKSPKSSLSEIIDNEDFDKVILNIALCLKWLDIEAVAEYIKSKWETFIKNPHTGYSTYFTKIVCAIDWYYNCPANEKVAQNGVLHN